MKAKTLPAISVVSLFTLCVVLFLSSCGSKNYRTIKQIQRSGEVRFAVFFDNPPFSWMNDEREYQGYDVYFARRLADELGVRPAFFHVKPDDRAESLMDGTIDIVVANYTVTEERSKLVAFSLPYMKVYLGVASPKAALITSEEQLSGKRLIVTEGATSDTYFSQNHPDVTLVRFSLFPQIFTALREGRGDAVAADAPSLLGWLSSNTDYALGIEAVGEPSMIAAAVNKENHELLKWLNDMIVKLGEEGFFHADYEATLRPSFGPDAEADELVVEGGKL